MILIVAKVFAAVFGGDQWNTPWRPESLNCVSIAHMPFVTKETITIEPWRAKPFPIVRDLRVDRSAFDRIIQSGGFISTSTGGTPDANAIPVPKSDSDRAMDAAQCIGCGACVAACKNASAMLFVSAKVGHLGLLPQGKSKRIAAFLPWSVRWTRKDLAVVRDGCVRSCLPQGNQSGFHFQNESRLRRSTLPFCLRSILIHAGSQNI